MNPLRLITLLLLALSTHFATAADAQPPSSSEVATAMKPYVESHKIAVNSHCLFADAETALNYAAKFGIKEPEPGPYFVVTVWRQRQQ